MAQTHDDRDGNDPLNEIRKAMFGEPRPFSEALGSAMERLRARAEEMTRRGENIITAGAPNERVLHEEDRGGFRLRHLPNDPFGLRISIGEADMGQLGGEWSGPTAYLTYRGDRSAVVALLRRALAAMES